MEKEEMEVRARHEERAKKGAIWPTCRKQEEQETRERLDDKRREALPRTSCPSFGPVLVSIGQGPNGIVQGSFDKTHQHLTITDTSTRTSFVVPYHFLRDSAFAIDHECEMLES